jgi:predicted transcriptional regulator
MTPAPRDRWQFILTRTSIYLYGQYRMKTFSTQEAARELGLTGATLSRYISSGKVSSPRKATSGGMTIHFWTEEEIEHVRQLLPKIANGRKTRYQKLRRKQKTTKTQPKAAAVRKPKKK